MQWCPCPCPAHLLAPSLQLALDSYVRVLAQTVIGVMILIVLAAVGSIFVLRLSLLKIEARGQLPAGLSAKIASLVNAIQIMVLNRVYGALARQLNNQGTVTCVL